MCGVRAGIEFASYASSEGEVGLGAQGGVDEVLEGRQYVTEERLCEENGDENAEGSNLLHGALPRRRKKIVEHIVAVERGDRNEVEENENDV